MALGESWGAEMSGSLIDLLRGLAAARHDDLSVADDAADAIEALLGIVRKTMEDHAEVKKFTAGFRPAAPCRCPLCRAAEKIIKRISS